MSLRRSLIVGVAVVVAWGLARRFRVEGDTFELSFTSPSADGSAITRTLVFRRSG